VHAEPDTSRDAHGLPDEDGGGRPGPEPFTAADITVFSQDLRFTLKWRGAFGVVNEIVGENLAGDIAAEPRVACSIDLAHAASAQRRLNFARAEAAAWHH